MNTRMIYEPDEESLKYAAKVIRDGGLVVFPTETVYGLGADALSSGAAEKIYKAKGRPSDNPLIITLPSVADVEKYAYPPKSFYKLSEKFLPGPLTCVVRKKSIIPDTVSAGLPTVAVRVPSNPIAQKLCALSGVPVAAPSANLSGKPSVTSLKSAIEDMYGRVDVIIDGGESEIGLESTIVSLDGDKAVLLRPGGITIEMLKEVIPDIEIGSSVKEEFIGRPSAPGMKYRHYAPDAPVYLLDGSDASVYEWITAKAEELAAEGKKVGVLCCDEDTPLLALPGSVSLGPRGDDGVQAHRLFECLRSFKEVDVIYGRLPEDSGLGLAVLNRLLKAAGFQIIKL